MKNLAGNIFIVYTAARVSLLDFFAMFTFRTYLLAWVPRIFTQIAFYGLFAAFAGGPDFVQFALIGNAVHLMNQTATGWVTGSVTGEQRLGTLPLLVASPSSPLLVLSSRNFGMGLHGYSTGLIGILVVAPLLGLTFNFTQALLIVCILLLIAFSCYSLGLILGGIVLRNRAYRSVLANLVTGIMLSLCGINYPVDMLPTWIQPISYILPLTHGLKAIHGVLAKAPVGTIWWQVVLEVAVCAVYLLVAQAIFRQLLFQSRREGTLELL